MDKEKKELILRNETYTMWLFYVEYFGIPSLGQSSKEVLNVNIYPLISVRRHKKNILPFVNVKTVLNRFRDL